MEAKQDEQRNGLPVKLYFGKLMQASYAQTANIQLGHTPKMSRLDIHFTALHIVHAEVFSRQTNPIN
jgi:hypothetical protein